MKRLLSLALALVMLSATLLTAGCSGKFENFCDSDLRRYVKISLSDFTGQTVKLSGVYPEVTREDALHELDYFRMLYSDSQLGDGYDVYLKKPGLWDQTYIYYDLTATENGNSVASNLFGEGGAQVASTGYWMFEDKLADYKETEGIYHPLFTSKALSDALLETLPAGRNYHTEGEAFSHPEGAILYIDYQLSFENGTTAAQSVKELRIDTGMRDYYENKYGEAFFNALLSAENKYGVNYEVKTTAKDKSGNDLPATYTVKVKYVSEETFTTVPIALAEDAFDETYAEALRALNGTTVYLHFFIHHYTDFVTPALDSKFVQGQLGYDPADDEDEESEIVEGAIAAMIQKLKNEQEEKIKQEAMATFMLAFYKESLVRKLPKGPYEEQYNYIVSTIQSAYIKDLNAAEKKGESFPYASVHEYAADYTDPKYSLEEFPTLESYADAVATETVSYRVFVMAMAQLAGTRISSVALRQEYEEVYERESADFTDENGYVGAPEEVIAVATNGDCTTEEEFEWYILWTITYGELTDYIYKNNTWQYEKQ